MTLVNAIIQVFFINLFKYTTQKVDKLKYPNKSLDKFTIGMIMYNIINIYI